MQLQVTIENTESLFHPRIVRVMIFDDSTGRMIHSTDFCLACLIAKVINKKELIFRETFSTGKETIHYDSQNQETGTARVAGVQNHGAEGDGENGIG